MVRTIQLLLPHLRGASFGILAGALLLNGACHSSSAPTTSRHRDRYPEPQGTPGPRQTPALALKMRSSDGRFIVTTDDAAWEVAQEYRHVTARWHRGVPVDVLRSKSPVSYRFRLVNRVDGSFANAKLGKRLD